MASAVGAFALQERLLRAGLTLAACFLLSPLQFAVHLAGAWTSEALWTRATTKTTDMVLALGVQAAVVALPLSQLWMPKGRWRTCFRALAPWATVVILESVLLPARSFSDLRSGLVDVSQFGAIPLASVALAAVALERLRNRG